MDREALHSFDQGVADGFSRVAVGEREQYDAAEVPIQARRRATG
jgi:hypothetical protein